MREILFKAKRKDNGEWVEGYLWSSRTIGHTSPCGNLDEIVIDPSTVCQYIGLTDSNGKRVFEGDILKFGDERHSYEWVGRVELGSPKGGFALGWQLVPMNNGMRTDGYILLWIGNKAVGAYSEVVGNIHDGEDEQHD